MVKVFVINGFPGSGKDTFVEFVNSSPLMGKSYIRNYHSSDIMKGIFKQLGWTGEKTPEVRNLMAELIEGSNKLFDTAFRDTLRLYVALEKGDKYGVLFIHERKPENIARLCNTFKAKAILVERGVPEIKKDLLSNKADNEVLEYNYDIYIDNSKSLVELKQRAEKFIKEEIQ